MKEYTAIIRETAKRLLSEKTVDAFVGYRKGSVPMVNQPVVITDPAQADELVWDRNCALNLTNYLTGRKDKVGVLATGCNSRNIVMHIKENQIQREQLVVVGVPCTGMIDPKKVRAAVDGKEILSVEEEGDQVVVTGDGFEKSLAVADVMQNNCMTCARRNPVIHDEMVAQEVPELDAAEAYADVASIEKLEDEERWDSFQGAFETCIRCYACRNACPLCYCPTCFVDEAKPQWIGKSIDPNDTLAFHFLRAFHMAGRCTDCGACERACPVDIPVRYLTKKLNKDTKGIFGYEAGMSEDGKPLLDDYKITDLNDFVR